MIRKFFKYALSLFITALVIFATIILLPRVYDVPPFQKRVGTQYWDLPTGSKIGYTKIPAKGDEKPYPIIYLHGGPGGKVGDTTIDVLKPLSEDGYAIYFYDQIGSGHSDRLENINHYSVDRHKKDLQEIVKKIGVTKVILIGHSWGALLATQFIEEHEDQVDKVIFTGPGPILPIRRELRNIKIPDSLRWKEPPHSNQQGNARVQNIRSKWMKRWAYISGKKLATDEEADAFGTYLFNELNKSAVSDETNIVNGTGGIGYYAHIMTVKTFNDVKNQRSNIKNTKLPVLVMRGQSDNQKWGFAAEYLDLFSNSKLVIVPNAGHFIEVEQPRLYLMHIRDFLNAN